MINDKPALPNAGTVRIHLRGDIPGPAYGVLQSTLLAEIEVPVEGVDFQDEDWDRVDRLIGPYLSRAAERDEAPFPDNLADRILDLAVSCLRNAGLPIFCEARLIDCLHGQDRFTLRAAFPSLAGNGKNILNALVWAVSTIWRALQSGSTGNLENAERATATRHGELVEKLGKLKLGGTNTLRFLEAAHAADIPVPALSDIYCQFGWGKNQLLAKSSILSTTHTLPVAIARDKFSTSQMLRRGGIPASVHDLADSLEHARKIAARLGYPVVVKPMNLDGGLGVFAGLRDERQLADAWNEASTHGRKILVEKHCEGEDFRLIVIDGALRWAVGRQPAGVTGDGRHSIAELVEISNRDPRRGYHATASLRPLTLGDEALGLLDEQECTLDSILEAGRFVRLRRASNLSSGGLPVVVTDAVHPDNRALVERAVDLIGLDVAGVDMIIPDIAKSWREVGGTIIEINAQPQLIAASQTHLYGDILRARINGNGRIPTALLLTGKDSGLIARLLERLAGPDFAGVGLAARGEAYLGGRSIGMSGLSPFHAGQALLMHRDVEALLVAADDTSLLKSGLPFDRFDMLVIAGPLPDTDDGERDDLEQLIDLVAEHCAGDIVMTDDAPVERLSQHRKLQKRTSRQMDTEKLVSRLLAHAAGGKADRVIR
ncbi:hypothetical protein U8326_10335 [Tsuneonella sp. CC-YZS046]|uniref:ATP-binding protein n=1 Tax=Tsuneonella sp. CC-YZS046 TaxID=3042152 RepID=UPI002D799489|nr:hypothetical protein [Tsuneonella sp. CC-YZS046]WRO65458.1 hypothetical protein U8326_10335 [Tsuneonella sp. CC-YZS046]